MRLIPICAMLLISGIALSSPQKLPPPITADPTGPYAPLKPKPPVQGEIEKVTSDCAIAGWAFDPGDPSKPIQIHLFVDDVLPSRRLPSITADKPRPDVNAKFKIAGDHGFAADLPRGTCDGKPHVLHVIGANMSMLSRPNMLTKSPTPIPVKK